MGRNITHEVHGGKKKLDDGTPRRDFALPGGRFPIPDKAHARAAELDAGHLPPAEKAKVDAKARKVLKGK